MIVCELNNFTLLEAFRSLSTSQNAGSTPKNQHQTQW